MKSGEFAAALNSALPLGETEDDIWNVALYLLLR